MSRLPCAAGLLAVMLSAGLADAADNDTKPKVVKLTDLMKAIQAHKGKVVVVDLWADG